MTIHLFYRNYQEVLCFSKSYIKQCTPLPIFKKFFIVMLFLFVALNLLLYQSIPYEHMDTILLDIGCIVITHTFDYVFALFYYKHKQGKHIQIDLQHQTCTLSRLHRIGKLNKQKSQIINEDHIMLGVQVIGFLCTSIFITRDANQTQFKELLEYIAS